MKVEPEVEGASRDAISKLMSAGDGPFASSSSSTEADDEELPIRLPTDYLTPTRPRRAYSSGVGSPLTDEPPISRSRASSGDDDDYSDLSRKPQNLEDLYAMFPKIGDGLHKIRVERLAPSVWRSASGGTFACQGRIGDFDEAIPLDEFEQRFGGHKYRVTVLGPPRSNDPQFDARGNPFLRTLKSVEFTIAGPPNLEVLPMKTSNGDEQTSQKLFGNMGNGMGLGLSPEVEKARIEAEYRRLEREAEERNQAHREARDAARQAAEAALRTPDRFIDILQKSGGQTLHELKAQSAQTVDLLKQQLEDLREQNAKLRAESDRLRSDIVSRQSDFERKLREAENERTAQLKGEHERELRRVAEESAKALEKLANSSRDEVSRITNQHVLELQRSEMAAAKEREMISRDAERRESQLSKDFERERTSTRETYEARITQLKDTYDARIRDLQSTFDREMSSVKDAKEREILSLKESRDREVAAIRAQFEMQTNVTRETGTLRVDTVNSELARVREELARYIQRSESAESELQTLRASQHKAPEEAIESATKLAALIGWGPKEDAPQGPPTDEEASADWKKTLARAGLGLVDKLPEIAQTVLATRGQAEAAQQQAAQQQAAMEQQARMAQAQAMEQRRRRMMAAQAQAGAARLPGPGLAPWQTSPAQMSAGPMMSQADGRGPQRAPMPSQVLTQAPPSPLSRFPSQQAPQRAPQHPSSAPTTTPPGSMFDAPAPAPEPALASLERPDEQTTQPMEASQGQDESDDGLNIEPEHMAKFFTELDKAIREGVIPPGMWARGFMSEVGEANAKKLVTKVPVEAVFEIAKQNESSVIVTRDGQAYTRAVWTEVASA